jgi:hypothetical protein
VRREAEERFPTGLERIGDGKGREIGLPCEARNKNKIMVWN